ncbi:MAG: ribosome biogenesis GTPase Der [Thermodesulfobacteriota bacterium]
MTSVVAIVGRPNVGKSTLFNRLSRSRDALVDDRPGITRDRLYAAIRWDGVPLRIIDTGGFAAGEDEPLLKSVKGQVLKAVDEADAVLFLVDGRKGPVPGDREIADLLRRYQKPVLVAANKIDGPEHETLAMDFYELGLEEVHPLSAAHGYGLRSLMNRLVSHLPPDREEETEPQRIRVAVVGRPNVGKSSLINRILGLDRLLVSDIPGTTRDSVDTPFSFEGTDFTLIDTAGLRRKSRVREKVDTYSMIKTMRSLDRCHVAVVLLDADAGVAEQDARICGFALERGRAMVLAINKWDLIKRDEERKPRFLKELDRQLEFVSFAPLFRISALTGERVNRLIPCIRDLWEPFCRRISTGEVNRVVARILERKPPPRTGRRAVRLFYATQTAVRPPTFVMFLNRPDLLHVSYKRFLVNQLREHFGLKQIPIRLYLRKREGRYS